MKFLILTKTRWRDWYQIAISREENPRGSGGHFRRKAELDAEGAPKGEGQDGPNQLISPSGVRGKAPAAGGIPSIATWYEDQEQWPQTVCPPRMQLAARRCRPDGRNAESSAASCASTVFAGYINPLRRMKPANWRKAEQGAFAHAGARARRMKTAAFWSSSSSRASR